MCGAWTSARPTRPASSPAATMAPSACGPSTMRYAILLLFGLHIPPAILSPSWAQLHVLCCLSLTGTDGHCSYRKQSVSLPVACQLYSRWLLDVLVCLRDN